VNNLLDLKEIDEHANESRSRSSFKAVCCIKYRKVG
jgi:hypothetical protein